MIWFSSIVLFVFIGSFVYGLIKQLRYSALLKRTVVPDTEAGKRLLYGNYLYSFTFAGFMVFVLLNAFVFLGILPRTQSTGNAASLIAMLFLLLMAVSKFVLIPKSDKNFLA